MKDVFSRNVKIIQISILGSLFCSSMPCHHLSRREDSHLWWGKGSNLCCQLSCWDPAGSQMEWAASRAIAYHSCKLPPVFMQCKPRTLGLQPSWAPPEHCQHYLLLGGMGSSTAAAATQFLAQRELQTLAVQTEELLLPWGAVARAQKSWLSCATEPCVSLPLKISEISKTLEPGAFPWLGNDQTSSHIQLPLSLEISCCPLPKRQEQPLLQSGSSSSSVLLSSAIAQLSSEP